MAWERGYIKLEMDSKAPVTIGTGGQHFEVAFWSQSHADGVAFQTHSQMHVGLGPLADTLH